MFNSVCYVQNSSFTSEAPTQAVARNGCATADGSTRITCELKRRVYNKAVIDRKLLPGVATREVTLSARKVVPCVRWPATALYYCAQLIAKPKAACALRFSWAATSSNLGL